MDQDVFVFCLVVLGVVIAVSAALVFWTRRVVPLTPVVRAAPPYLPDPVRALQASPAVRAREVAVMSVATAGAGAVAGCAAASVATRPGVDPDFVEDDGLLVGLGFMSAVCDSSTVNGDPVVCECGSPDAGGSVEC
jgi:hypothetical protein